MNTLPQDVIQKHLLPIFSSSEFFNFTGTCKTFRLDLDVQTKIEQVKKSIDDFINKYGAIAKCEAGISIKTLREKIEKIYLEEDDDKPLEVKKLFTDISKEFFAEELDKAYPLQEMKNKCRRIITINKIHKILLKCSCYPYSFGSSSNNSNGFEIVQRPNYPLHFIELNDFIREKQVVLSEPTLRLDQQQVTCTIAARLELSEAGNNLSEETRIYLFKKSDNRLLGSLQVYKYDQDNLCAQVSGVRIFDLTKDQEENRISIMQCIIQIAVEIFMRESYSLLILGDVGKYPTVAAGFSFYSKDFNKLDTLKNKIGKAREGGDLYPHFNGDTEPFKMHKTDSLEFGTQFVNKIKKDDKEVIVGPALVDFEMKALPITWEKKIKKSPLIQLKEGPILPTFYTT